MANRLLTRFHPKSFHTRISCASIHVSAKIPNSQHNYPSRTFGQDVQRPLRTIPLSVLIRSLSVLSVAALPSPILAFFVRTTRNHSKRIASSSILKWLLTRTFYNTFCIGETKTEITTNMTNLRSMGISGVILAYAREADLDSVSEDSELTKDDPQFKHWLQCNLETVEQINEGDFLAVKYTGAGEAAVRALEKYGVNPGEAERRELNMIRNAMVDVCEAAEKKGASVLVDAEYTRQEKAIDDITLELMERFNKNGKAVVYNTYQMYLKSTLAKMKSHLQRSSERGYTMGIKMVRGAYIHFEPDRSIIHDTKQQTDDNYNNAVAYLLSPNSEEYGAAKKWKAEVVIATHNDATVEKALAMIQKEGGVGRNSETGVQRLNFGQLMGMADEVSMSLASTIRGTNNASGSFDASSNDTLDVEKQSRGALNNIGIYKYTVWGSFQDCLLYLLRRAEENKDAVARSRTTAKVMMLEILRRMTLFR